MNDFESKIDELFNDFERTDLYKRYLSVKSKMQNNKEIMDLIKEIKRLQKIATNNEDEVIEKHIKELYTKLDEYPLYQSYLIIKDELEEELFRIKDPLDKYFKDILNLSDLHK